MRETVAIDNTVYEFMQRYDSGRLRTKDGLEAYFSEYPGFFEEYFPKHCPKTDERLIRAIEQYPGKIKDIEAAGQRLPEEIEKVEAAYRELTGIDPHMDHHLFVGTFGSNAFIGGKEKNDAYYALEMLSPDPDDLRLVAAHETGHVVQYRMSGEAGGETWWRHVDWSHPAVTLMSEGGALHLSKLAVPGLDQPSYTSFGTLPEEGYGFFMANKRQIKDEFLKDMDGGWTGGNEMEWFRLSGGRRHGFSRLGYYLAGEFMERRAEIRGLEPALTDWDRLTLEEEVHDYLKE
ncbi:aminopeptidase [Bhargavaea ullalensis]|uniref:DUF2268 domain-containing protein n=1 Tax=Bhargavaea ullalensis TaxID=1265685 RepID=A0ABV2GBR8_9BACL